MQCFTWAIVTHAMFLPVHCFTCADLQNLTLRLPPTHVPPHETTYSCMLFRLHDDTSRHLVAAQPLLNNTSTVHHMLLFGCRDDGNVLCFVLGQILVSPVVVVLLFVDLTTTIILFVKKAK